VSVVTRTGTKGQTEAEFHPGFRTSRSVVLHRFGVDPMYKAWRLRLLGNEHLADMVESVETEIKQVQQLVEPGSPRSTVRRGLPWGTGCCSRNGTRRSCSASA
jgi:hypothetical protein